MKFIDLHVHSNISDGTFTPTQVVNIAYEKGLAAIALSDHDTINGISEALKAAEQINNKLGEFELIPATELSAAYKKKDIHILGMYIDYTSKNLKQTLDDVVNERKQRNEKMAKNLANAGIDITIEKLLENEGNAVITRAHFAKYITEHGYTKTFDEAFKKYLSPDGPYYVQRKFLTPKEAINLIKSANGVPVLAHPLLYNLKNNELDKLICELKSYGLMGIEAIYTRNTGFDESYIRNFAKKYDLIVTGGSDFHGSNKPDIQIGFGTGNLRIPYHILEELKKVAGK